MEGWFVRFGALPMLTADIALVVVALALCTSICAYLLAGGDQFEPPVRERR